MTTPIWPNVSADQYAIDRYQLTVHTSLGRRVALNGQHFTLTACDWPSAKLAEEAASMAAIIFAKNEAYRCFPLENMADWIARELGQDLDRPYAYDLHLEPV